MTPDLFMSLAPVVWHIQHGPISSQFPKFMGSWKKLISNPNWKRHSYIQQFMLLTLRKLRVWPAGVTLTDTWGLDTHIQQVLCVCVCSVSLYDMLVSWKSDSFSVKPEEGNIVLVLNTSPWSLSPGINVSLQRAVYAHQSQIRFSGCE